MYFRPFQCFEPALFDKPQKMGFGGKTLSLIKSLYKNDLIKFFINGKYTGPLYLLKGVKQGKFISKEITITL